MKSFALNTRSIMLFHTHLPLFLLILLKISFVTLITKKVTFYAFLVIEPLHPFSLKCQTSPVLLSTTLAVSTIFGILNIKSEIELDEAVEHFTTEIHNAANMSTSIPNSSVQQHFSNFDVSLEIRQLLREKRRLRKRWQISRHPFDKQLFNKSCKDL